MKAVLSVILSAVFIVALVVSTPLSTGTVGMQMINAALNDNPIGTVQIFPSSQSTKEDESSSYIVKVSRSKQDQNRMPPFSVVLSIVGDSNLAKQLDEKVSSQESNQEGKHNRASAQARFNYPILRFEEGGVDAKNSTLTLSGLRPGVYGFNVKAQTLSEIPDHVQSNPVRLQVLKAEYNTEDGRNTASSAEKASSSTNINGPPGDIIRQKTTPNHSPAAKAGRDLQVAGGSKVLLDASDSTDVDKGDILSFAWDQVYPQAPQVKLTEQQSSSPKASFEAPNVRDDTNFRFRLDVRDNNGGLATDFIQVLVKSSKSEAQAATTPNTSKDSVEIPQSPEISQNHAPVATISQSVSTAQSRPITVLLQANDPDDADELTFSILLNPSHGTIAGFDKSSGRVTYVPSFGFSGKDALRFKVTDSKAAESNEGVLSISVGESTEAGSQTDSSTSTKLNLTSSDSSPAGASPSVSSLPDSLQKTEERKTLLEQIRSEKLKETKGEKVPDQYLIVLKNDISSDKVVDLVNDAKSRGAKLLHQYQKALRGFSINVPNEEVLASILNSSDVVYAEPDVKVKTFTTEGTPGQILPTGVDRVDGDLSYAVSGDGKGDKINADIAILDTGISLSHPDLNLFKHISFVPGVTSGNDDNGHGTMVAGIAAAEDNGIGVVGIAPGARLWAIKVLDSTGTGSLSSVVQGIDYLTQHANEIEVADMSFGCDDCNSQILNTAISNAVSAGVIVIAAAGNAGKDASTFSPANHPDVIAVSAIADSDGKCGGLGQSISGNTDDNLASFSNYGSVIDMAAPGVKIYSTSKDAEYSSASGTSMAAPHVAGAAALYKAKNQESSPAQIRIALQSEGSLSSNQCDPTIGSGGHGYFKSDKDSIVEPLLYVGNVSPVKPAPANSENNTTTANANSTSGATSPASTPTNITLPAFNGTSLSGNLTNATLGGNATGLGNGTFSAQACCFCPTGPVVVINCGDATTNDPDGKVIIDLHCGASPACNTAGSFRVAILDPGANIDPNNVNVAFAHVSTATDPTGFTVQMVEPGPNSANFTKLFSLGPASIYPDTIAYSPGDTVELVYSFSPNPGVKAAQAAFFPPGSPDSNTISSGSDSITLNLGTCTPSSSGFADNSGFASASPGTTDYSFIKKWGSSQLLTSNFRQPTATEIDSTCNVFVVDYGNARLQKFASDGTFLDSIGTGGLSMAIDTANNIYVADNSNNQIKKFDSNGNLITAWGGTGSGDGEFAGGAVGSPLGIAVAHLSWCDCDLVYSADYGNNRIQIFHSDGAFFGSFGTIGPNDGQFDHPYDIEVYPAGEGSVYVTDRGNNRVQKFNSTGSFIGKWGGAGSGDGQFTNPDGIAVDPSSNVFVTDENHRVQKFDSNGQFISKWGSRGSVNSGLFDNPIGVSTDKVGNVYVADFSNDRIQMFSNTGVFTSKWGIFSFLSMSSVAYDHLNDIVYVPDSVNSRVVKFIGLSAATSPQIAKLGVGPPLPTCFVATCLNGDGLLNNPASVAVDPVSGDVYVADGSLQPVQKFGATGNFLSKFSIIRPGDGGLVFPSGMAANSTHVFITETAHHTVRVHDAAGNFVTMWGSQGSAIGQFNFPRGVALDSAGMIYVTDFVNNRVQKFQLSNPCPGTTTPVVTGVCFVTQWGTQGTADGQFSGPFGIGIDGSGDVLVADNNNHRVQKFTNTGTFITKFGSSGNGNGQFNGLGQLSVDPITGTVFTEEGIQRIQVFAPETPLASITIDTIDNDSPLWGIDTIQIDGTTTGSVNGDTVSIDWDDGDVTTAQIQSGGTWTATHTYPIPSPTAQIPTEIVATLLDNTNVVKATSSPQPISIQKHTTSLSLNPSPDPVAGTFISASGILTDVHTGTQISNKDITFTGSGGAALTSPVTSVGISFTNPQPPVAPGVPIEVELCSNCPLDDGSGNGNNVAIDLMVGGKITLPAGIKGVELGLLGNSVTIKYTRGDNSIITMDTQGQPSFEQEFEEGIKEIEITQVNGGSTGLARISHLTLVDHRALHPELVQLDFESLTPCQACHPSPLVVEPGFYISLGASPPGNPQTGLTVDAQFNNANDLAYEPSNVASITYDTIFDTTGGISADTGALAYTGARFVKISNVCQNIGSDSDNDGLCDAWETTGTTTTSSHAFVTCPGNDASGLPLDYKCVDSAARYDLCFDDQFAGAWGQSPKKVCPKVGHKDIFVELDYMTGHIPDKNAIQDVIKAFGTAPVSNSVQDDYGHTSGITLHVVVDTSTGESPLPRVAPLRVWQDQAGASCANPPRTGADCNNTNDFRFIKEYHFGTATEHGLTSSQATAPTSRTAAINTTLDLKHYAYHYGLYISTWNNPNNPSVSCVANPQSGPPSGQAETYGNDFIVSLGCNFGTTDSEGHTDTAGGTVGTRDEQAGTLMHELGHNLGLSHGGMQIDGAPLGPGPVPPFGSSNYAKNCKPNYLSVMNYARQIPNAMVNPQWSQTTQHDAIWSGGTVPIKSFLDYSREDLKTTTSAYLNEGTLVESAGLKPTASANTGLVAGDKVRIIWGTPSLLVKTQRVDVPVGGSGINWDADATPGFEGAYSPAAIIDLSNLGISGCGAGTDSTVTGPDDWHNLVLKFTNRDESKDGIFSNSRRTAELTSQQVAHFNLQGQQFIGAMEPINLDGSSVFQHGRTIPVKLQLRNPDGSFNPNALITFTVEKISNSIAGTVTETTYSSTVTVGSLFKYDSGTNQYIYNWSTRDLDRGTYVIRAIIDYNTPQATVLVGPGLVGITAQVSLR